MTLKYEVIRKGTSGCAANFGGLHQTLKEAIWYAKELKKRHGGEWIVVKDGRTVWRDGMSYEEALRLCRVRKSEGD